MPKVLVANRGEIAIRILRAASELGWETVAIFTEGDENHATFAQEVVKLTAVSDFVTVESIIAVAVKTHCTHLHPGYGFLSENPALPLALPESIIFIGPSVDALRISSDKVLSRELATSLQVKVAPGLPVSTSDDVDAFGRTHGYPLMIKALDGGGGRGIRKVECENDVQEAFDRCLGESPSRQLFVEKALTGPSWKHIEVQIVGDGTGAVTQFWERECSVQRRFQKIIEMAPSRLPRRIIEPLINSALKMAKHLNYRGLGTFEFLVNSQTFEWAFLEINPRVQVEHTVTEEIVGVDLVRAQLRLFMPSATLSSLSLSSTSAPNGCAIQLRLTAEDPGSSFRLSTGTIHLPDVSWPSGRGIRLDTWLAFGPGFADLPSDCKVGTDFDSLLAKIIVHGADFEEANQKARRALMETNVRGPVITNRALLSRIIDHPDWLAGDVDTLWLERNLEVILRTGPPSGSPSPRTSILDVKPRATSVSQGSIVLQPGTVFNLSFSLSDDQFNTNAEVHKHNLMLSSIVHNGFPEQLSGTLQTSMSPSPLHFSISKSSSAAISSTIFELGDPNNDTHVLSPFTAKIVQLHSALSPDEKGSKLVKKGESLIVLVVMKMENVVTAPYDALVERTGRGIRVGEILGEGTLVCVLSRSESMSSRL